ncbi:MAG: hypothetical protein COU85_00265 [Candidatus Portnoybacteria bacterium CG10_big_fil_rev_8_21_14_0_10_44_7]|uniref:Uncharacterized protein n=1 Tax=Candidatus Portnoybacteria bacterium CG10_big_fil_rev_8_21_14_0_10_44_7 TaxID=1974816 RepID=A0A2M8KJI6_9BACT|nr:MAG: hypothetical protein COU85_00265 [Candidatus Portnoybacteria bacterium CG10_big_fil_rev_8_21_14_0_10_44_7]
MKQDDKNKLSPKAKKFITQRLGSQPEVIPRVLRFLNKGFCLAGRVRLACLFIAAAQKGIKISILLEYCQGHWEIIWRHQPLAWRADPEMPTNRRVFRDVWIAAGLETLFG